MKHSTNTGLTSSGFEQSSPGILIGLAIREGWRLVYKTDKHLADWHSIGDNILVTCAQISINSGENQQLTWLEGLGGRAVGGGGPNP